jgi:lipoprotein-anchoring transpeptidase ErfK/SrfK
MSSHRRDVRPRYGRIAALATSLTVCALAALAGIGVFASGSPPAGASARPASYTQPTQSASPPSVTQSDGVGSTDPATTPDGPSANPGTASSKTPPRAPSSSATDALALPSDSGTGRRVVFSQHLQRVWLVGSAHDAVQQTYLVSGSVTHNLVPGTYSVYSKSRWAVGVDDSGVMQYFVRFTQGPTGAAIGFHTIPTKNGVPLQAKAQLGTPQSHGCIRQATPDAIALWDFAPVGTKVVVVP